MTRYTTCLLCSFIAYFASSAVAATVPSQITDGQIQAPTAVAHVSQTSDGQIQAPVENGCPPSSGYTGASPTVTIANGVLHGTTVSLPSATAAVNKFLGVPFAQSPPLRFAPPQPAKSWATPLDVTVWKPACIQQFTYPLASQQFTESIFNTPAPQESEDCLYLNVYAPASPPPPGGRTVMFWIYGGSLQFGNAGQAAYDGSSFAAYQDVIIVSANYRTNVFGFVGSPELPLTGQNPGFFDQRLGLEWVQQNIAAFGGNPSKVTIFGESAGAGSVDRLVTTLPGTKLFRAAITESGQASINPSPSTNATVAWNTLVQMLNCTTAASQLACVRSKPATVIQTIIDQAALIFTPTSDGVTQLVNGQAARLAGNIAKVPLLTGTNAQEGRVFVVGDNNLTAFLATFFAGQTQYQRLLAAAYPVGGLYPTAYDAIAQIFTEEVFQCPAAIVANATAALGIPTWRYFFNASFPNTQSYPGLGVFHSSEIPIVFGTYPTVNVTAQEYALSKFMQGAWANFAKNPTGGPGWNALGTFPADGDLGDLGPAGSSGVTIIPQYPLDARCGLFAPVYAALANNTGDF